MLRKIRVNKKRVEIRLKKKEGEKVAAFKITFEGKKIFRPAIEKIFLPIFLLQLTMIFSRGRNRTSYTNRLRVFEMHFICYDNSVSLLVIRFR